MAIEIGLGNHREAGQQIGLFRAIAQFARHAEAGQIGLLRFGEMSIEVEIVAVNPPESG